MQKDKIEESLKFVTRHYRREAFSVREGLTKLGFTPRQWWRRPGVAAAAVVGVVLMASAAVYVISDHQSSNEAPQITVEETNAVVNPMSVSQKITFEDTDLTTVVKEIERVYGVKIENIPSEEYRLTLSYEGTATDLVETINELLGIELKIAE